MSEIYYRRYTDLPSLIGMLTDGCLTLVSPASWDDKNDSFFLEQYRRKRGLKSLFALCFTAAPETYHHWRVFAPGSAGVCVWFHPNALNQVVLATPGLRMEPVEYMTLEQIGRERLKAARLPFAKRFPFKPEAEVRMLWQSKSNELESLSVPFPSTAIERIVLSPWLHPSLVDSTTSMLKSLPECRRYRVHRSTLIGNDDWKEFGRKAR